MKNFIKILFLLTLTGKYSIFAEWVQGTMFQCTNYYGIPSQRLFNEKGTCQLACAGHNRCKAVPVNVITHPVYGAPIAASKPYSASFATGTASEGQPIVNAPLAPAGSAATTVSFSPKTTGLRTITVSAADIKSVPELRK